MTCHRFVWGLSALMWWLTLGCASPLSAATVETTISLEMREIGCTVRLNGVIETGDFEKLSAVLSVPPSYDDPNWPKIYSPSIDFGFPFATHRLCLNSPGGSFLEGLRIAEGLAQFQDEDNHTGIPTGIASGDRCESACSLIFMSGRYAFLEDIESYWRRNQVMHPKAILGFHSPIVTLRNNSYAREEVLQAWAIGMKAVSLLSQQINSGSIFVNPPLFSDLLETIPPDMIHVNTVSDALRWGIDVLYPSLELLQFSAAEIAANLCINATLIASDRFEIVPMRVVRAEVVSTTEVDRGRINVFQVLDGFGSNKSDQRYNCRARWTAYGGMLSNMGFGSFADVSFEFVEGGMSPFGDAPFRISGLGAFPPNTHLEDLFSLSDDPENVRSRFSLCPDQDNPGLDLLPNGIRDVTLSECAAACEREANCGGFSFVKSSGWCWPKSEVSCSKYSRRDPKPIGKPGVITGVR